MLCYQSNGTEVRTRGALLGSTDPLENISISMIYIENRKSYTRLKLVRAS